MAYSLPGSSVRGILQARLLEWLPCAPPGYISFFFFFFYFIVIVFVSVNMERRKYSNLKVDFQTLSLGGA
jgi:hypothetical protein